MEPLVTSGKTILSCALDEHHACLPVDPATGGMSSESGTLPVVLPIEVLGGKLSMLSSG